MTNHKRRDEIVSGDVKHLGSKTRSDGAGIGNIIERAAAARCVFGCGLRNALLIPQLHGHADDALAIAAQQSGHYRAVHSAGHGDGNRRS